MVLNLDLTNLSSFFALIEQKGFWEVLFFIFQQKYIKRCELRKHLTLSSTTIQNLIQLFLEKKIIEQNPEKKLYLTPIGLTFINKCIGLFLNLKESNFI